MYLPLNGVVCGVVFFQRPIKTIQVIVFIGTPGEIRTPDLLIRSQMLYPAELLAHGTPFLPNHPNGRQVSRTYRAARREPTLSRPDNLPVREKSRRRPGFAPCMPHKSHITSIMDIKKFGLGR